MALEVELAYFGQHLEELLKKHPGQYVLIKGSELVGAFTTEAQAYEAGVQRFGNQPFLIRKATSEEPGTNYFALRFGLLRAHV